MIVAPALLALLALRLVKPSMIVWLFAWWIALWVIFDFGFATPVPSSVVKLYMGIVTLALLAYVGSDPKRWRQVRDPTIRFLTEPKFLPALIAIGLAIPVALGAAIYLDATEPPRPPTFGRTIHPAPPNQITVHGETHDLTTLENPYRELEERDSEEFRRRVAEGRRVYYENCFYCHGDLMRGEGIFAHALNPIPTNFQDPGTIAQLQESFLFWRIAKGGIGLPEEGGPWMSAMPAWEQFLSTEEMWNVILILYDFTGHSPRARHATAPTATEGEP
ncbi:MAG: cytochrome c [Thermoanaerobaculia bacterium]|nr:cytochrome c [Thermoanaerobaculia bacterium]